MTVFREPLLPTLLASPPRPSRKTRTATTPSGDFKSFKEKANREEVLYDPCCKVGQRHGQCRRERVLASSAIGWSDSFVVDVTNEIPDFVFTDFALTRPASHDCPQSIVEEFSFNSQGYKVIQPGAGEKFVSVSHVLSTSLDMPNCKLVPQDVYEELKRGQEQHERDNGFPESATKAEPAINYDPTDEDAPSTTYCRVLTLNSYYSDLMHVVLSVCLFSVSEYSHFQFLSMLTLSARVSDYVFSFLVILNLAARAYVARKLALKDLERECQDVVSDTKIWVWGRSFSEIKLIRLEMIVFYLVGIPTLIRELPILCHPRKDVRPFGACKVSPHVSHKAVRCFLIGYPNAAVFRVENNPGRHEMILVQTCMTALLSLAKVWVFFDSEVEDVGLASLVTNIGPSSLLICLNMVEHWKLNRARKQARKWLDEACKSRSTRQKKSAREIIKFHFGEEMMDASIKAGQIGGRDDTSIDIERERTFMRKTRCAELARELQLWWLHDYKRVAQEVNDLECPFRCDNTMDVFEWTFWAMRAITRHEQVPSSFRGPELSEYFCGNMLKLATAYPWKRDLPDVLANTGFSRSPTHPDWMHLHWDKDGESHKMAKVEFWERGHPPKELLRDAVMCESVITRVAVMEGQPMGIIAVDVSKRHIVHLHVLHQHRRSATLTQLVRWAQLYARQQGWHELHADIGILPQIVVSDLEPGCSSNNERAKVNHTFFCDSCLQHKASTEYFRCSRRDLLVCSECQKLGHHARLKFFERHGFTRSLEKRDVVAAVQWKGVCPSTNIRITLLPQCSVANPHVEAVADMIRRSLKGAKEMHSSGEDDLGRNIRCHWQVFIALAPKRPWEALAAAVIGLHSGDDNNAEREMELAGVAAIDPHKCYLKHVVIVRKYAKCGMEHSLIGVAKDWALAHGMGQLSYRVVKRQKFVVEVGGEDEYEDDEDEEVAAA